MAVADLRLSTQRLAALVACLSSAERGRADAFHRRADRERYVAARGLLRELLATQLGLEANEVALAVDSRGKPVLDPASGLADLRFNASRSGQRAVFAWAIGRDVGVDVEFVRDLDLEGVAARALSEVELHAWRELPAVERIPAFFAAWSRKEAYVKGVGEGLALGLDTVEPQPTARLGRWVVGAAGGSWTVDDVDAGPGYSAAVASPGEDWRLVVGAPA